MTLDLATLLCYSLDPAQHAWMAAPVANAAFGTDTRNNHARRIIPLLDAVLRCRAHELIGSQTSQPAVPT